MASQPAPTTNPARSLFTALGQEAAFAWRVSPKMAAILFLVPMAGAIVAVLSSVDHAVFELVTGSESPLDWSRFAAYALAAGLAAAIARRLWRAGRGREFILYVLFAIACLLIAGDQIAWGQPLVGGAAPGETPAAAIDQVPHAADALMALAGVFGAAAPWLAFRRRHSRQPTETMRLTIPPLFLSSGFFLVVVYEIVNVAISRPLVASFGEWAHMWLAISLMAFALLTYQRLRRASTPVLPLSCGGGRVLF
jgi:hypothetical protein